MKTQKAILKRIEATLDFFGSQERVLVSYLNFDNARQFLRPWDLKLIEDGKVAWKVHNNPVEDIKEFFTSELPKIENNVSATRALFQLRAWVWLDGMCYKEFDKLFTKFSNGYLSADDIFTFVKNFYKIQTK